MSSMWMWISGRGEDQISTIHVEGLDRYRRQAWLDTVIAIAYTAIVIFVVALQLGHLGAAWYWALILVIMILAAAAGGVLAGMLWGRYYVLREFSRAEVRSEVHHLDDEDDEPSPN